MNFKHIWIVFKKEMKDTFRDKKSVMTNILLPLVMIPLMYFAMNLMIKNTKKDVEENMKIGLINNQNISMSEEFTKKNIIGEDKIEVLKFENIEVANKSIMDGKVNCLVLYEDNFFDNLSKGITSGIKLKYNSTKNSSQTGMQMVKSKIMMLNSFLASQKLIELNISPEILSLISTNEEDAYIEVSSNGKSADNFLMMLIPMYLVTIVVTAGMPLAIDLFAGERERNTFEALLSTKANRLSILLGKYMSVLVFSIIAIITSFIGLILGVALNPEMFSNSVSTSTGILQTLSSLNIPIGAFILALLSAVTLAMVFGGIQIAVSTYAKTLKEAQTYLSYMMLPAMIPAFMTMFMGAGDMQFYMTCIPIFNTIASLKMVLRWCYKLWIFDNECYCKHSIYVYSYVYCYSYV
ncbi:MAG: ABC transporter permease subunit [Clostridia bacterium]